MGTIGNSDLLSAVLTVLVLYLLGSYVVETSRTRYLYLAGALGAWGALLLSEVLAGPVAISGTLALLLPMCLSKGIGIRSLGQILGGLSLLALGKSILGYHFQDDTLTLFFQWTTLSTLLALLTILALLAIVPLRRLAPGKAYPKAGKALWMTYGVLVLGTFLFLFFYTGTNETLLGLSQLLHGDPPELLGSGRIAIWKDAVDLGLEKPLLGGGPDTYNLRSELTFSREVTPGNIRTTSVDAAHNEYLNLWVNCGLPAMVLHLGLVASVLVPALKHLDRKRLALVLPALGYAIHALFGISQSVSSPLFYLFLGACVLPAKGRSE